MEGSEHNKDGDCTLDETGTCKVCGVYHGDPCEFCGQEGFHADDCQSFEATGLMWAMVMEPEEEH